MNRPPKKAILALVAASFVFVGEASGEDLACLSESERTATQLYAHLQQMAFADLDRRIEAYQQLKTPDQIRDYQQ